jgi:hypothetical protein
MQQRIGYAVLAYLLSCPRMDRRDIHQLKSNFKVKFRQSKLQYALLPPRPIMLSCVCVIFSRAPSWGEYASRPEQDSYNQPTYVQKSAKQHYQSKPIIRFVIVSIDPDGGLRVTHIIRPRTKGDQQGCDQGYNPRQRKDRRVVGGHSIHTSVMGIPSELDKIWVCTWRCKERYISRYF